MVGVCLTGIGLIKIAEARVGPLRVDEYLAVDALVFVASGLMSYVALRYATSARKAARYETVADYLFMAGMLSMAIVSVLFAFDIV